MNIEIRLEATCPDNDKKAKPAIRYKLYDGDVCVGDYETEEEVARAKYQLIQMHRARDGAAGVHQKIQD